MKKLLILLTLQYSVFIHAMDSESPAEHLARQIREEDQREFEEKARKRREKTRETPELALEEDLSQSRILSLKRLSLDSYVESNQFREIVQAIITYMTSSPDATFEQAFNTLADRFNLPLDLLESLQPYIIKAQIDDEGNSLIHWALENNYPPQEIAYLLSLYPNIHLFNKEGLTVAQAIFIKAINEGIAPAIERVIINVHHSLEPRIEQAVATLFDLKNGHKEGKLDFNSAWNQFKENFNLSSAENAEVEEAAKNISWLEALREFIQTEEWFNFNQYVPDKIFLGVIEEACNPYGLAITNFIEQERALVDDFIFAAEDEPREYPNIEQYFFTSPLTPERTIAYFTQDTTKFAKFLRFRGLYEDIFTPPTDIPFSLPISLETQEIFNNILFSWTFEQTKEFVQKQLAETSSLDLLKIGLIHALAQNDRGRLINLLVNTYHLNPLIQDPLNRTPFHVGVAALALDYILNFPNVDINLKDDNNETPLYILMGIIPQKNIFDSTAINLIKRLIIKDASIFQDIKIAGTKSVTIPSFLDFTYKNGVLAFWIPFYHAITQKEEFTLSALQDIKSKNVILDKDSRKSLLQNLYSIIKNNLLPPNMILTILQFLTKAGIFTTITLKASDEGSSQRAAEEIISTPELLKEWSSK